MTVMKEQEQTLTDGRILYLIDQFNRSARRAWMFVGRQYYQVDNDILNRRITKMVEGQKVEETGKANNKLAHGKYKTQVDEKVSYLLSKPYTLKCEDEGYAEKVKDTLGGKFEYNLSLLGYEASNCSIGWLLPYIDEQGHFQTMDKACLVVERSGKQNCPVNFGALRADIHHVKTPVLIIFTGPAVYPKVTNQTTGEFVAVRKELLEDETLYINTAYGEKSIEIEKNGVRRNGYNYIDQNSFLSFNLAVGDNILEYSNGRTDLTNAVEVRYRRRYLGI